MNDSILSDTQFGFDTICGYKRANRCECTSIEIRFATLDFICSAHYFVILKLNAMEMNGVCVRLVEW